MKCSNMRYGSMHHVRHCQHSSLASAASVLQHSRLTTAVDVLRFPALCRRHRFRSTLTNCTSDALRPSQSGGNEPLWLEQQQQQAEDPVAAMLWAAQQDGMKIVVEDEYDLDELEAVMEDLEDPWMRNPSPPEWSDSPLFVGPDISSGGSSSSVSAAAVAHSSSGSSDGVITPSSQFVTLDWHQLEELMQQRHKQQCLIVLEVQCPESQQQQQEEQQQQQPPPCRPLPGPLPWIGTSQPGPCVQQQQHQHHQQQVPLLQHDRIQIVKLGLADVTRDAAVAWQQAGAVVAVWDSGHHSCLAAAIRLSAVYRLPDVVLLQQP